MTRLLEQIKPLLKNENKDYCKKIYRSVQSALSENKLLTQATQVSSSDGSCANIIEAVDEAIGKIYSLEASINKIAKDGKRGKIQSFKNPELLKNLEDSTIAEIYRLEEVITTILADNFANLVKLNKNLDKDLSHLLKESNKDTVYNLKATQDKMTRHQEDIMTAISLGLHRTRRYFDVAGEIVPRGFSGSHANPDISAKNICGDDKLSATTMDQMSDSMSILFSEVINTSLDELANKFQAIMNQNSNIQKNTITNLHNELLSEIDSRANMQAETSKNCVFMFEKSVNNTQNHATQVFRSFSEQQTFI